MTNTFLDIFSAMEQYAVSYKVPIIHKEGAQLLQQVIAKHQPTAILEIGTAIGYSTLLLAVNMADNGKITTIELDEQRMAMAKQFLAKAGILDKITCITGNAGEVVAELPGKFDFVFIDAAKGQYLDYLHKIIDKLSPGAVIIADNVLFRGWVMNKQETPRRFRTIVKRLQAYLDFVTTDSRFTTVIHQAGDGIAVSYFQGETKYEQ